MTTRRRTTWIIAGLLGIAAAGGYAITRFPRGKVIPDASPSTTPAPEVSTATLAENLKRGDIPSLSAISGRLIEGPEGNVKPLTDDEGRAWVAVVAGLREGYPRFTGGNARAAAIAAVGPILRKFAVEPSPGTWLETLVPIRDLFNAGLSDPDTAVRVTTLGVIGKVWEWYPARSLLPIEESELAAWKDVFCGPVKLKLADRDPRTRAAAVACLALAPIDSIAAQAVVYIDDPQSGEVRHQVMVSFASRPALLTVDMVLKRLYDPEPGVPELAELILRTRGLSNDQIALGRMVTSPRPEMRASVLGLVKDREDLDPVVWLLRLSHDPDEMVRSKSVEAMTGKDSPDLRARLRELAARDTSESIRAAAAKLVAAFATTDTTASLPPLPGTPSLTPKAN